MSVLSGKNIVLGISGGIAAYKTATLVRLFIKAGAHVQVIMTPASKDFITPLTLSTLSKRPVFSSFYKEEETLNSEFENPNQNLEWNNHVEIGLWADLMLIAPATANTLSKMANGICDNLLIATYLSAKCPVFFAPAMLPPFTLSPLHNALSLTAQTSARLAPTALSIPCLVRTGLERASLARRGPGGTAWAKATRQLARRAPLALPAAAALRCPRPSFLATMPSLAPRRWALCPALGAPT
jgi:3-polyprenyl-4-hydroxybenzoate decarboxylase